MLTTYIIPDLIVRLHAWYIIPHRSPSSFRLRTPHMHEHFIVRPRCADRTPSLVVRTKLG